MAVDPAASMRIWAVELELGAGATRRVFEVPALPAADWFPLLVSGDLGGIIDILDDSTQVDEMLVSGEVSAEDLTTALTAVVEQVSGRPLHAALALAQIANDLWPAIGGEMALAGFRWDQQPIAAALDAIDRAAMRLFTKEYREKIRAIVDSEVSPVGTGRSRRRVNRAAARAEFEKMAGPPPTARQGAPASGARSEGVPPRIPRPLQRPRQAGPYAAPRTPPVPPAESDPPASHVDHGAGHGPTSGNGSPLPQPTR